MTFEGSLNDVSDLKRVLDAYRDGSASYEKTVERISEVERLAAEATTIDHDRHRRTGSAEVIYGEFKTANQVVSAFKSIRDSGHSVLATRVKPDAMEALSREIDDVKAYDIAHIACWEHPDRLPDVPATTIGVVTAGTSDLPVAEEAAITAEFYGNKIERIFDVGVAGVHRLLKRVDSIRSCRVIVVVAGMEGALPSVVGGLVDKPVIAVPTSVGYGAAFNGIAALLGMLTSCASGVSVVNIDNGFGAGFLANIINRL